MKFGIGLAPYAKWPALESLVEVVTHADRLRFDYVLLPDHVAVPAGPEQPRSGSLFYDPFVLASFLAARTTHIRFVLGALVVPLRHPLNLARALASLDQVSQGRLNVVAGTGWLRPEFEALGVPFEKRGQLTDEWLAAMRALWTEEEPQFDGEHVSFPAMTSNPRCVQQPHIPIWVGGTGRAPFRRLVRFGQGWMPMTGTFEEQAAHIRQIKESVSDAARDAEVLDFVGGLRVGQPDDAVRQLSRGHHSVAKDVSDAERRQADTTEAVLERIDQARSAGFTHLTLSQAWDTPEQLVEKLHDFSLRVFTD